MIDGLLDNSSLSTPFKQSEREESMRTVVQLAKDMGYLDEDLNEETIPPNASITHEKKVNRLLYHSVTDSTEQRWKPNLKRLQPPQYFKLYYRSIDPDLDKAVKDDKSGKDKAWLAYWKRACDAEASSNEQCKESLCTDSSKKNGRCIQSFDVFVDGALISLLV